MKRAHLNGPLFLKAHFMLIGSLCGKSRWSSVNIKTIRSKTIVAKSAFENFNLWTPQTCAATMATAGRLCFVNIKFINSLLCYITVEK